MIYECAGSLRGGGTQNSCELMSLCKCSPGILFAVVSISRFNFFAANECRLLEINEITNANHGAQALSTFYFQVGGRLVHL